MEVKAFASLDKDEGEESMINPWFLVSHTNRVMLPLTKWGKTGGLTGFEEKNQEFSLDMLI